MKDEKRKAKLQLSFFAFILGLQFPRSGVRVSENLKSLQKFLGGENRGKVFW